MDQQPGKLSFATDWQYSAAPESTDHIRIAEQYGLFIGGEFVAAKSGKSFETVNPGQKILANWHIKAIAWQLEQCVRGDIKRLIIEMIKFIFRGLKDNRAITLTLFNKQGNIT